jgi:tetratricopeptide (TPR) repeat protein
MKMTAATPNVSITEVQRAHQELIAAENARVAGDLNGAQKRCQDLLEHHTDYFGARTTLALIHMQQGDFKRALPQLVKASMLNPNDSIILTNMGRVYLYLDAVESAVQVLEKAVEIDPYDSIALSLLGESYVLIFEYGKAMEYFKKAMEFDPSQTGAVIGLGSCYQQLGFNDEAIETFISAIQMPLTRDQQMLAYYTLSELPDLPANFDLLASINNVQNVHDGDLNLSQIYLECARATTFHKLGRHKDAWECWSAINSAIAENTAEMCEPFFLESQEHLDKATNWKFPEKQLSVKDSADTPVSLFILGPSRAGKSTLEEHLSYIDGLKIGDEYQIVSKTAQRVSQHAKMPTEKLLVNLPAIMNKSIAETYHAQLKEITGEAKALTMTNPGIIIDVGRLAECVSNARFVFVKRQMDDNAFKIFSKVYKIDTNFNFFASDIKEIYRYLTWYNTMIDNWMDKLGNRAMTLQYEDLVEKPISSLELVAEFCGFKPPDEPKQHIIDGRGCAEPYLTWLHAARDET